MRTFSELTPDQLTQAKKSDRGVIYANGKRFFVK